MLDADGYAIPETLQVRNTSANPNATGGAASEDAFDKHATSQEPVGKDAAVNAEAVSPYVHNPFAHAISVRLEQHCDLIP